VSRWDSAWDDMIGFRGKNKLENPDGEWNEMVIIAQGDRLEIYFNGEKVNEASMVLPNTGQILIQSEWAELFVRRWEIWPVGEAPVPKNPMQ